MDNTGIKYYVMGWNSIMNDYIKLGKMQNSIEDAKKLVNTRYGSYAKKYKIIKREVIETEVESVVG